MKKNDRITRRKSGGVNGGGKIIVNRESSGTKNVRKSGKSNNVWKAVISTGSMMKDVVVDSEGGEDLEGYVDMGDDNNVIGKRRGKKDVVMKGRKMIAK